MGGKDEAIEASMTVVLVCYACRTTHDTYVYIDYVDSVYLFGITMKFGSRCYVWDTSCSYCDA